MSIHCTVPLLCSSATALSSFFTHEPPSPTTITTTSNSNSNNNLLFSVLCIYSFCASCACNVRNASTCWLRAVILHLSSALSDHHRDFSDSLVVHPTCPTSLYVILRSIKLVFSVTIKITFSILVTGLNAHQLSIASTNIFIPLRDSSHPLLVIPKCLRILW